MKIAVLIKQVPDTNRPRALDPETGLVDRAATEAVLDEIDERALAAALRLRDTADTDTEIVVLTMGPPSAGEALRRCLAVGADSAVHVLDDTLAGSDAVRTSAVLATALRTVEPDLVIAGCESTDGKTGAVPAMLAQRLDYAQATYLCSLSVSESGVTGERTDETGVVELSADFPCIVSVTEQAAEPKTPNLKGIMAAKKKTLRILSTADLPVSTSEVSRIRMLETVPRPPRSSGVLVEDNGTAAQQIVDLLRQNQAI
ncbi:electron transfer flavoprotein subunit beta [Kocuria dechangensis]|uniref:Electron transfer flavoprotein subunit beta n=1 Tax=Kocuria dechangensis TaxID=1176249 RepID=A0A917H2K6_9MICC|nr:electron transfer flavoprotein subunit beta/FixA family protein [Kocuria dechangensis]GGG65975.1 electron transfer flavoprotein subunit beta [Kocuria dechangensis]